VRFGPAHGNGPTTATPTGPPPPFSPPAPARAATQCRPPPTPAGRVPCRLTDPPPPPRSPSLHTAPQARPLPLLFSPLRPCWVLSSLYLFSLRLRHEAAGRTHASPSLHPIPPYKRSRASLPLLSFHTSLPATRRLAGFRPKGRCFPRSEVSSPRTQFTRMWPRLIVFSLPLSRRNIPRPSPATGEPSPSTNASTPPPVHRLTDARFRSGLLPHLSLPGVLPLGPWCLIRCHLRT
jgi:hypothetical protein